MTAIGWMGRQLQTTGGLYNDRALDHFIAVKHAWADAAVRQLARIGRRPRVLETHAGYGWLTVTYAMAGADVVAIERSAPAVTMLAANTIGLPIHIRHGDNTALLPGETFDIIDIDASGTPQPALDLVLAHYRPRLLFVTFGEGLHFRIRHNQGPELAAGARLYGDTWREHWREVHGHEFGRVIGFNHIRRAWPEARLVGCHVWPRSSSTRLAVALGPGTVELPDRATAEAWAAQQAAWAAQQVG